MARVPYVNRGELHAEGQQIYDRIRHDRGNTELSLHYRALMNSPRATGYLASLGAEVLFHSPLPQNLKELAIMLVAREWNNDRVWAGHSVAAVKAGVSPATVEIIQTGRAPQGLTGEEAAIARFVQGALRYKQVSGETFGEVHGILGDRGVVDLLLLVAYYTALGLAQIALQVEMDPGQVSSLDPGG